MTNGPLRRLRLRGPQMMAASFASDEEGIWRAVCQSAIQYRQ